MEVGQWLRENCVIIRTHISHMEELLHELYRRRLISDEEKNQIENPFVNKTDRQKWDKVSDILVRKSIRLSVPILEEIFNATKNDYVLDQIEMVQRHHFGKMALTLAGVEELQPKWSFLAVELCTSRAIANFRNEQDLETKIMKIIEAWSNQLGKNAYYNLFINKIRPVSEKGANDLEEIREELSGFKSP